MMLRTGLPFLAALLVVAVLGLWLLPSEPAPDSLAPPTARTPLADPPDVDEELSPRAIAERSTSPAEVRAPSGQIRVGREERTLERFEGHGQVFVRSLRLGAERPQAIAIRAGSWSWPTTWNADDLIAIDHFVLDGDPALPLAGGYREIESIGSSLDALWAADLSFRVVDAVTGSPLRQVEVRYSDEPSPQHAHTLEELRRRTAIEDFRPERVFRQVELELPTAPEASDQVLVENATSPVRVPSRSPLGTYWITASGYEWAAWPETSSRNDPLPEVRLRRTGELNVRIEGMHFLDPRERAAVALVRSTTGASVVEEPLPATGQLSFHDLAEGEYELRLTVRSERNRVRILDRASVDLAPGRSQTIVLTTHGQTSTIATLDGHLFIEHDIPGFDGPTELWLRKEGESEITSVGLTLVNRDAKVHYSRLDSTLVTPGRYRIAARKLPYEWSVELADGTNVLELEVADLRLRTLRVIDPATREPIIEPVSLTLGIHVDLIEPESQSFAKSVRTLTTETGSIQIYLPSTNVAVSARSSSRGVEWTRLDVPRGRIDLAVELPSRPSAHVTLATNGRETPFTFEWLAAIQAFDADGSAVDLAPTWDWSGDGPPTAKLWFPEPGRYELRPADSPGLPKLEAVSVTVSAEQIAEARFSVTEGDG